VKELDDLIAEIVVDSYDEDESVAAFCAVLRAARCGGPLP
jgi:hypothetical protein